MKRFVQWAMLLVAGLTLFMVGIVFVWENARNILALMIMACLFAVILKQAENLGLLDL